MFYLLVTCLAFKPDGKEIAVGTLDCAITFCSSESSTEFGSIDCRNHLGSGRSDHDKITAAKSLQGKSFRSLAYSPDGSYILAGGQSKTICLYSAERHLLLRKFQITQNKSLDCMSVSSTSGIDGCNTFKLCLVFLRLQDFIHHRKLTEFGNMDLLEERGDGDVLALPGVRRGDMSSRSTKPEVRVSCIQFSPTGDSWIAATTEGLLLYAQSSKKSLCLLTRMRQSLRLVFEVRWLKGNSTKVISNNSVAYSVSIFEFPVAHSSCFGSASEFT